MPDFPQSDPAETPELSLANGVAAIGCALGTLLIAALPYVHW